MSGVIALAILLAILSISLVVFVVALEVRDYLELQTARRTKSEWWPKTQDINGRAIVDLGDLTRAQRRCYMDDRSSS